MADKSGCAGRLAWQIPSPKDGLTMMTLFASAVAAVFLLYIVGQFGLRVIYSYDIRDGAIWFVLFSMFPIARIPMSDVVEVSRATNRTLWLNPWRTLRLGNRIFGASVVIRRQRGLIRSIVITPSDPDRFIDQCNAMMSERVGNE
jgi:hypothetical protein